MNKTRAPWLAAGCQQVDGLGHGINTQDRIMGWKISVIRPHGNEKTSAIFLN